jgi:hypothetical protein
MVPITDPAEIATLERRIREAEKQLAAANGTPEKPKASRRR